MIDCSNDSGRANGIVADRARYTWEHGLERNCPVHSRRKNTLMIFVGVSPPLANLGQATLIPVH
jgi:hypothetical protein